MFLLAVSGGLCEFQCLYSYSNLPHCTFVRSCPKLKYVAHFTLNRQLNYFCSNQQQATWHWSLHLYICTVQILRRGRLWFLICFLFYLKPAETVWGLLLFLPLPLAQQNSPQTESLWNQNVIRTPLVFFKLGNVIYQSRRLVDKTGTSLTVTLIFNTVKPYQTPDPIWCLLLFSVFYIKSLSTWYHWLESSGLSSIRQWNLYCETFGSLMGLKHFVSFLYWWDVCTVCQE